MTGPMLTGWIVSNAFTLALVFICWKLPKVGRAIFGLGFVAAAAVNMVTALSNPQSYVHGFGPLALFEFYENFIYGPFARNPALFVLPIALGQLAIGALMFFRGFWFKLGLVGGMVFFLAITPLGAGSTFPMPLLGIVALWVLWQRS